MFTGIVEERGTVLSIAPRRLVVGCRTVPDDSAVGASVAVNGVCLTVVQRTPERLTFDLSEETLARTSLSRLAAGDAVNLERPLTLSSRLGGHLVQGHVDGVGTVVSVDGDRSGAVVTIRPPKALLHYVIEKGSIGVDGVSLTVARVSDGAFAVALIPHTLAVTTLGATGVGEPVNLEVDVIAKYVQALMEGSGR